LTAIQDLIIKLFHIVVEWIKSNILSPLLPSKVKTAAPAQLQTVAGEHYVQPQPGQPTAWLIGIEDYVRGRSYPVTKVKYRIDSKANNKLCIKGDDYVSGNRAYLRYERGCLYIFDEDSRNGTFLNSRPVAKIPIIGCQGDRIRVGASAWQLSDSLDPSGSIPGNGDDNQNGAHVPTSVPDKAID
jgi:hypothetical protein